MRRLSQFMMLLASLGATAPAVAQGFASAVAVGEDDVLVAEPLNEMSPGVVYVYQRSDGGWREVAQLTASDATAGDHFGRGLALDGNTAIIGATVPNETTGLAYVFEKNSAGSWEETARLIASDGSPGDAFGRVAALDGNVAMVASWAHAEQAGAVYVFRRDNDGTWNEYAKLVGEDTDAGDWFGTALALHGEWALVGVPQKNGNRGAAYLFRHDAAAGRWRQAAKLTMSEAVSNARFGTAVAFLGDQVLVSAPGVNGFEGAVHVFGRDPDSGEWSEQGTIVPFDGSPRIQFGTAMAVQESALWVGAPGADGEGRVYRFVRDEAAAGWQSVTKLTADEIDDGDALAGTIAVRGDLAVAGALGDDYGAGTAVIFERTAERGWHASRKVVGEIRSVEPVVGGEIRCSDGVAAHFGCQDVDMVSFLPIHALGGGRGVRLNDIWGWTDPETGREYALVGRIEGTAFVDVTDPANPIYLGQLLKTEGSHAATWRDIKVYANHAFIVADGAGQHGMQVFDLTQLRDVQNPPVTFTETAHYDNIASAHNIVINEETGFAYSVGGRSGGETCGGGLHMINIQDPVRPTFAGCFADPSTGRRKTGYSHDAQCVEYRGPDQEHVGKEICFGSNETALSIADVTDKDNPLPLAMATYPNVGYSHQGWLTDDQQYFFMDDELDELSGSVPSTRTLIWDVKDLDDPVLVKEYMSDNRSSDHNLYIKGNLMYQSNYVSGLRVFDISDPENPVPVGFFDTVPYGEDAPGFNGSWSNYPFFQSGSIVVTSVREGLFVLKKRPQEIIP